MLHQSPGLLVAHGFAEKAETGYNGDGEKACHEGNG